MKENRARLIQSSLAYATASLIAITLHEFGHGLIGLLVGQHPTVYALHEHDIAGSRMDVGLIATAGPVLSLLLGIIFLWIYKYQKGQGFGRYLTLWLGLFSTASFFGYLMTAPFLASGDIAVVLRVMHLGVVFRWLSFIIGSAGIILVSRLALPRLVQLTNADAPLRGQTIALASLSWIVGSIIVLIAILPTPPLMAPLIGLFVPFINFLASRRDPKQSYGVPGASPTLSYLGIGLLIVLVILEQTVLKTGVKL